MAKEKRITTSISSKKIEDITKFIQEYLLKYGFPPSFREICEAIKIKSTATVYYYMEKMEALKIIKRYKDKNRCIELLPPYDKFGDQPEKSIRVPLVGKIAAGIPITAIENIDETFDLPTNLFRTGGSELFMLKVSGESMINAGILDGDLILIKKQNTADNGEIVAVMIEEEATLKRFYMEPNRIILKPENNNMQDIVIDNKQNPQILGLAVGLIRSNL